MLFRDEDLMGGHLFSRKGRSRRPVLRVNARVSRRKKISPYKFLMVAVISVAAIVLIFLAVYGAGFFWRAVFSENRRFDVAHIEIITSHEAEIDKETIQEWLGIAEGVNLFKLDIDGMRTNVLSNASNIRSIDITRRFPNTIHVAVSERVPVARLGRRSSYVVDEDGYIFRQVGGLYRLPYISGYSRVKSAGDKITGFGLSAVNVLDQCAREPRLGIEIESVEVERDGTLLLILQDRKPVAFSWEGIGEASRESRENMIERLVDLSGALKKAQGIESGMLNFTLNKSAYGS